MRKYLPIYLYGAIIIFEGIMLLFSDNCSFQTVRFTTGITLSTGAFIAFIAAYSRQQKHVQFTYHQLHALAMLVYGVSCLLFCDNFEKLISFTAFLFIFYSFSESIFCNWLLNLRRRMLYRIIFIRFFLGLLIGIGTVLAMLNFQYTLEGFGFLFILVGINILLYVPVIKAKEYDDLHLQS